MTQTVSAASLREALARRGCGGTVEARGRMAILTIPDVLGAMLADDAFRAELTREARRHGFTHLAVEIVVGHAALSGD